MEDVIIVGAGPAGLTCALYLLRANKKVRILEAKNYGGQIVNASKVENYPGIVRISGYDFATNLYQQVLNLGGKITYETVVKVLGDKTVITNNNTYHGDFVVLATGACNRKLGLPLESKFLGKGLSYCATCDGNFYQNKVVAVIGGGNTALEDALYLSLIARKVYLIHRRDSFRGEEKYIKEVEAQDNIEIIYNANVVALAGEEQLEQITIQDNLGKQKELEVQGLFIAIGQVPQNEVFNNIVDINEYGYIITHDEVYTKTEGIYAVGDNRVKSLRQLTTAVSDGSIAATEIIKNMAKKSK